MSAMLSRMNKKKSYKTLYETELNNRKLIERHCKDLEQRYVDLQNEKGLPELKLKLMELADKSEALEIENAKLKLDLEDLQGFYNQEKEAKEKLLEERNKKDGE